jgi:N-acetylmuramoyl-L-alanine amidase
MADCPSRRLHNPRYRGLGWLLVAVAATGVFAGSQPRNSSKGSTKKSAPADSDPSARVTAVRFWSLGDVTRVAIEVNSEFQFKSDRLPNPDRLFYDIQGAKPELSENRTHVVAVGDPLLKQIRVAETQPGVTRVVLDLEQPVAESTSQLSNPDRLIIELRAKGAKPGDAPVPPTVSVNRSTTLPPPAESHVEAHVETRSGTHGETQVDSHGPAESAVAEVARPSHRAFVPPAHRSTSHEPPQRTVITYLAPSLPLSVKTPVPLSSVRRELPPPPPDAEAAPVKAAIANGGVANAVIAKTVRPAPAAPDTAEPLPAKHSTEGDRSLTRVLGLKLGRVVLDPGHGGHDVGTHGPSGLNEKDLVLDVAQRLGTLIEDRMGSEVIYTRSEDTFIPLEERTAIANQHKADLFLSIHANSSPYRSAAGVETYILNFTTSKTALDVAARENASSERSVFDLKETLNKIALKDKIDESREFATRLQTALWAISAKQNVAAQNRGVKKAPFVVLIGAQMPSVLAEIGFLTNAGDEALLRKNEQRQKIAEALYKGIAAYADSLSHFQVAKRE